MSATTSTATNTEQLPNLGREWEQSEIDAWKGLQGMLAEFDKIEYLDVDQDICHVEVSRTYVVTRPTLVAALDRAAEFLDELEENPAENWGE